MKRALYILAVILILASAAGVSVDRHFCGGRVVDVRLLLDNHRANCGMEVNKKPDPFCDIFDVNCCHNDITRFIVDNYIAGSILKPEKPYVSVLAEYNIPNSGKGLLFYLTSSISNDSGPPGLSESTTDPQSLFCIYRI